MPALLKAYDAEDAGPLFLSESNQNAGQPISKWSITKIFEEIRRALGLPQLTPHKLRYHLLTHLMDNGLDPYEVSRYACYRSSASTEIYLHIADAKLARQVNKAHELQWKRLESLFKEPEMQVEAVFMPTPNSLAQTFQEEPFPFCMPIEPSDYPDRTPALTEEERKGIAYLLPLPSARYLEFERQARVLSRVTQPRMDVLALFQQRRPQRLGVPAPVPEISPGSGAPDEHPVLGMVKHHLGVGH